mgnify:CR=1 FL=1
MMLPVSRAVIDYGGLALLILLVIEFAVEALRGKFKSYGLFPFVGPSKNEGKAISVIKALSEAVFLDAFASEPLSDCHTGAYYSKKPKIKRAAHLLFFYGFILLLISTLLGFVFDKWLNQRTFIPSYTLGPFGPTLEIGTGTLGGVLIIIGFVLYWPNRFRGEVNLRVVATDAFLLLLVLTVLTGIFLEYSELTSAVYLISYVFWIHISFVLALFVTMPYTKFSHAVYQLVWNFYERYYRRTGKPARVPAG